MGSEAQQIAEAYRISLPFAEKIVEVSDAVGIADPAFLANVIKIESNFDPRAVNPYSQATGLIQFMPKTARELGTSISTIRNMSWSQQLDYVKRYFMLPRVRKHAPFTNQIQTFMAVFYPPYAKLPSMTPFPLIVVQQNKGILTPYHYYAKAKKRLKLSRTRFPWRMAAMWGGSIAVIAGLGWYFREDLRDLIEG
jgi:hypothetical protein